MLATAVAHRYAEALVQVATGDGDPWRIDDELEGFTRLLDESAELCILLAHPAVPRERKHAVVEQLIARLNYSRTLRNFLFVLVDHRRTNLLSVIRQEFRQRLDARLGVVEVAVRAADELSEAERRRLAEVLARLTGRKIELQVERDPELLGGVVARIGSTIYDGSIREQLRRIQEQLSAE